MLLTNENGGQVIIGLEGNRKRIYEALTNEGQTTAEIAKKSFSARPTAGNHLKAMQAMGLCYAEMVIPANGGLIPVWRLGKGVKVSTAYQKKNKDEYYARRRRGSWYEVPLAKSWVDMCQPYERSVA